LPVAHRLVDDSEWPGLIVAKHEFQTVSRNAAIAYVERRKSLLKLFVLPEFDGPSILAGASRAHVFESGTDLP
jgi:hypothetical protein